MKEQPVAEEAEHSLEVSEPKARSRAVTTKTPTAIGTEQLKTMISVETENRKLLTEFIKNHLVDGVDYGKIHISKNCQNKYECKNPNHFSKDTLFKPGAEKFCSLFKLRALFKRDNDTWEMTGSQAGLICYICELVDGKGMVVGEGRGAASVAEKGNPNTAIKIAEKRAKLDAVLASGGLSDFFTQDMEDLPPDVSQLEPEDRSPYEPDPAEPERDRLIKSIKGLLFLAPQDIVEKTAALGELEKMTLDSLQRLEGRLNAAVDQGIDEVTSGK